VKQLAWRISVFCLLVLVASNAARFGRAGWFEAFVNNRTFHEPFGWLDIAGLILWSFEFLFFFAMGILVSGLFRSHRPGLWALAFGAICGALHLLPSHHGFSPDASWSVYFWVYSIYFIPALAAWTGAFSHKLVPNYSLKRTAAGRL